MGKQKKKPKHKRRVATPSAPRSASDAASKVRSLQGPTLPGVMPDLGTARGGRVPTAMFVQSPAAHPYTPMTQPFAPFDKFFDVTMSALESKIQAESSIIRAETTTHVADVQVDVAKQMSHFRTTATRWQVATIIIVLLAYVGAILLLNNSIRSRIEKEVGPLRKSLSEIQDLLSSSLREKQAPADAGTPPARPKGDTPPFH